MYGEKGAKLRHTGQRGGHKWVRRRLKTWTDSGAVKEKIVHFGVQA